MTMLKNIFIACAAIGVVFPPFIPFTLIAICVVVWQQGKSGDILPAQLGLQEHARREWKKLNPNAFPQHPAPQFVLALPKPPQWMVEAKAKRLAATREFHTAETQDMYGWPMPSNL